MAVQTKVTPMITPPGTSAELVAITAEMATKMLEMNTANRPIRQAVIRRLELDIRGGLWRLNGDTIKISRSGTILDGQHRLWAIFNTGVTCQSWIVRNLDDEVFASLANQAPRTLADVLALGDDPPEDARALGAAIRLVYRWEMNQLASINTNPSAALLMEVAARHPQLRESLQWGKKVGYRLPPAVATFCHYILARIDRTQADKFFAAVISGAGLQEGNPIYRLRELLANTRAKGRNVQPHYRIAWIFKAWNYERNNEDVQLIMWRTTEDIPVPK